MSENAVELANLLLDGEVSPSDLHARHAIGTKVEGEHTSDPKKKARIAREHEKENPLYYPSKPKPKGKKEALRWVESEGPCRNCHPAPEGRRKELTDLGWTSQGWGWEGTEWVNIPKAYYVRDSVIDSLPDDEWQLILSRTNAQRPGDDDALSAKLTTIDDRADQERAKTAARSFLNNRPKAQVIGDQTTIGM